jgi:Na+/H+ antiporter NhaC
MLMIPIPTCNPLLFVVMAVVIGALLIRHASPWGRVMIVALMILSCFVLLGKFDPSRSSFTGYQDARWTSRYR